MLALYIDEQNFGKFWSTLNYSASLGSEYFDIGKIAWLGSPCVKTDKIQEREISQIKTEE